MELAVDSDPSLIDARAVAQHLQSDPVCGLTRQEACPASRVRRPERDPGRATDPRMAQAPRAVP